MKIGLGFLLILSVLAEEDYKELPNTALGTISNVLESQTLPVGRGFSPNAIKASFSIATIISQVIKGQVEPGDKLVLAMHNISQVFRSRIDELSSGIKTEIRSISGEIYASQVINSLRAKSNQLAAKSLDLLKYNASVDEISRFCLFCETSDSYPERLVEELKNNVIEPCNEKMSPERISRFAETMHLLTETDISAETKTALAYYSTIKMEEDLERLVDRFLELLHQQGDEDISNYDLIRKLDGPGSSYGTTCIYESLYFEKDCSKEKLTSFMATVENIMRPIALGAIVCSAIRFEDTGRRQKFLETLESQLDSFANFQEVYYENALTTSFHTCHPSWINDTVRRFGASGPIDEFRFHEVAAKLLTMLAKRGDPSQLRHIVVSKNLNLNTKYFPSCPSGRCKVIVNPAKEVSIFYTHHNGSDSKLQNNEDFFRDSIRQIEQVVHDNSAQERLDTIRQALAKQNLSLVDSSRYETEVWIRQWATVGDCPLSFSMATNNKVKNYEMLSFYYRNWGTIKACENFEIFVFP